MCCRVNLTLTRLTEEHYLPSRLAMRSRSAYQLRLLVRDFERFAGPVPLCRVTDELVTAWLRWLLARGLSPATANTRRRGINTLRLWAWRQGFVDAPPRWVPRLREPHRVPAAWTVEEISALLRTARRWPGRIGEHAAADWWYALILCIYWTGVRIGDVMAARAGSVDWRAGVWTCLATKTGHEQRYRLHPTCLAALCKLRQPDAQRPLFFWPYSYGHLFVAFRAIVCHAGVRYDGQPRQLFHRLRRTCLSYCWAIDPALAQRQAGHFSAATTWRFYVDPTLTGERSAADVLPVPDCR
jgi:integrase